MKFNIEIIYDEQANIWVAKSDEVPCVTEAETLNELLRNLSEIVPEILNENKKNHKERLLDLMAGQIKIEKDFDEIPEGFEEYTESENKDPCFAKMCGAQCFVECQEKYYYEQRLGNRPLDKTCEEYYEID